MAKKKADEPTATIATLETSAVADDVVRQLLTRYKQLTLDQQATFLNSIPPHFDFEQLKGVVEQSGKAHVVEYVRQLKWPQPGHSARDQKIESLRAAGKSPAKIAQDQTIELDEDGVKKAIRRIKNRKKHNAAAHHEFLQKVSTLIPHISSILRNGKVEMSWTVAEKEADCGFKLLLTPLSDDGGINALSLPK